MSKNNPADDPSVDLIRVNMLNSTISMSYPDVVIACIGYIKVSLEAFRAIEAALVKHDNNIEDYSLVVD